MSITNEPLNDITKLDVSPLESQILAQYQHLANQLQTLDQHIQRLTKTTRLVGDDQSADKLLDNYRNLEMKIGLVYNLFKGAVYLLFLQNEEDPYEERVQREEVEDDDKGEQHQEQAQNDEQLT